MNIEENLDAQKPKRLFLPVLQAESWNDDIDFYLECGLAEMVTVECPSYPEVKEGVLLKEGFVTVQEMENKMSVMGHRMISWTNRMRDLDRVEMRTLQQRMRDIDRAEMRADMATEMAELRDSALLHCKGMRKIASTQVTVSYCGICFDKEVSGYICQQCPYAVCIRCFPMAFQTRVYSVDSSIDYTCPYCIQTFASFPEVSIDLGEHGDEQEQVTGVEQEQVTDADIDSAHLHS